MSALFTSQHVPRAPKLKIEGGDFKSGAEVGKFFQRGQSPARNGREFDFRRKQQISVGTAIGASHSSAKLVKLRKPEPIRAVDQNRVAERDVETVFDDRGGDQNVGFVMHEFHHHFFEFAFRHLSVANDDSRFWHQRLKFCGDLPDRVDPVVYEINLAVAFEFLLHRRLNQLFVPTGDDRLDRHAVFGRSLDYTHVA